MMNFQVLLNGRYDLFQFRKCFVRLVAFHIGKNTVYPQNNLHWVQRYRTANHSKPRQKEAGATPELLKAVCYQNYVFLS